jgi:hypothetical protein
MLMFCFVVCFICIGGILEHRCNLAWKEAVNFSIYARGKGINISVINESKWLESKWNLWLSQDFRKALFDKYEASLDGCND